MKSGTDSMVATTERKIRECMRHPNIVNATRRKIELIERGIDGMIGIGIADDTEIEVGPTSLCGAAREIPRCVFII